MNLDKKALAGFIKEVEDSRTRQQGETEFQRGVFKRAREKHFDVKAMRIVLQRRAMEPGKRDEQDYNVHAYELALGAKKLAVEAMEQGASAREAAKAHNLPRAAVAALKAGTENGNFEPPHDSETGEITDDVAQPEASNAGAGTEAQARGGGRVAGGGMAPVVDGQGTEEGTGGAGEQLDSDGTRRGEAGPCCDAQGRTERPEPGAGRQAEDANPVRLTPPDTAVDDMMAAHARLEASKRAKGISA